MEINKIQYADDWVTRQKFYDQLGKFKSLEQHYREMGIILLEEHYPNLHFGFLVPGLRPMPLLFSVRINFINYDAEPLSVRFVHPLNFEELKAGEVLTRLPRKLDDSPIPQELLQFDSEIQDPFFCIPGVREYHQHPYHDGESWFLIRNRGNEGSLCFILDNLHLYGISHVSGYYFQFQFNTPQVGVGSNPHLIPK